MAQPQTTRPSPHFFQRDSDGSARLRLRFDPELASLIEEAAGAEKLLDWMMGTLRREARRDADAARATRPHVGPPIE